MSGGVQIINQPEDYYDVFSSDLFNGTSRRPLNWLEKHNQELSKRDKEKNQSTQNTKEILYE